ncbi:MAG: hypothetical protein ACRYFB_09080 [Janthinobacterium lividum]
MTNRRRKTEEQIHYESLASFLKWSVSITGTLIVVLASVAIYVSYSDRNAMREDYQKAITDFNTQIISLKNEEKETVKAIKSDALESLGSINSDAKETIIAVKGNLKDEITSTNYSTQNELLRIKKETNSLALTETQKQVDNVFKSTKIQDIIENSAIKEIKQKVASLVNTSTQNLTKINDAASKIRIGLPQGIDELRSYFIKPNNPTDSSYAKGLYDRIYNDYYTIRMKDTTSIKENFELIAGTKYTSFRIINNKFPSNENERKTLKFFIDIIIDKENKYDLNSTVMAAIFLSKIANKNFNIFEPDAILKWYNGLKK